MAHDPGLNNSVQHTGVRWILDTVVQGLWENPTRRFTYAEQGFFQRWWHQQNEPTRDRVRTLVKRGQLAFVGGGCVTSNSCVLRHVACDAITIAVQLRARTPHTRSAAQADSLVLTKQHAAAKPCLLTPKTCLYVYYTGGPSTTKPAHITSQ